MVTTIALTTVMTAYADHIDNHIWIETAEGNFVMETQKAKDHIEAHYRYDGFVESHWLTCDINKLFRISHGWTAPSVEKINEINALNQRRDECGNKETEERYLNNVKSSINKTEEEYQAHHECLCGYWYVNTVQDEYKYTIIDLPRDRELPPNYKNIVTTGVEAGFDKWADINNITFSYTDSRLQADIVIQQHIGDGRQMGNAIPGCLFDEEQCTIQLFTDVNVGKQQTLLSAPAIEYTIAHEFGHLIGLPHHIDPDHIMNTVHANDVRDYWEARNINVPRMTEPINEQKILGKDNDYIDHTKDIDTNNTNKFDNTIVYGGASAKDINTKEQVNTNLILTTNTTTTTIDIDQFMKHPTVTEYLELLQTILTNTPEDDRQDILVEIRSAILTHIVRSEYWK